jgi:hypothetical protein
MPDMKVFGILALIVAAMAIYEVWDSQIDSDKPDQEYQPPAVATASQPRWGAVLAPAGLDVGGGGCFEAQMKVDIFCGAQPNGCRDLQWTAVNCWITGLE